MSVSGVSADVKFPALWGAEAREGRLVLSVQSKPALRTLRLNAGTFGKNEFGFWGNASYVSVGGGVALVIGEGFAKDGEQTVKAIIQISIDANKILSLVVTNESGTELFQTTSDAVVSVGRVNIVGG